MPTPTLATPLFLFGLALALPPGAAAAAETWTLEETSTIGFTAFQKDQPVQGRFEAFTAEIVFDRDDLAGSRITVEIDTASVDTGHKDRDSTLRSSQFFDVEQWPSARFASDELIHQGGDAYEARGTLTIRDVSEEIALPFALTITETDGRLEAHAEGEVTISRLDFDIGRGEWSDTSQIGEDVVVRVAIDATREP